MAAEEALILTPREVGNIRAYVRRKYAGLPQDRHAEIVADAMRSIVMRQLPDYDDACKMRLTDRLIRHTVLEQRRPVNPADLLHACTQEDWRSPERLDPLHRWVERRLGREIELSVFVASVERHLSHSAADDLKGRGLQPGDAHLLWEWLEHAVPAPAESAFAAGDAMAGAFPVTPLRPLKVQPVLYGLLSAVLLGAITIYGWQTSETAAGDSLKPSTVAGTEAEPVKVIALPANELPSELQYHEVDRDRLADYLNGKGSILARPDYTDAIIAEARNFNIHPLLLFAITGQEQGFVPADAKQAEKIANNPFNVYHSWQEFNTSIGHSSAIAARTIVNLSKNRPPDVDPIKWINRKYAEDPEWHAGVSKLLRALREAAESPGKS